MDSNTLASAPVPMAVAPMRDSGAGPRGSTYQVSPPNQGEELILTHKIPLVGFDRLALGADYANVKK
eukprot:SAG31_NODE_16600_length_703_cov_0.693709_1_plen_66_part_10